MYDDIFKTLFTPGYIAYSRPYIGILLTHEGLALCIRDSPTMEGLIQMRRNVYWYICKESMRSDR